MFVCPLPPNFGQKYLPKARNRDKAQFATKVSKSSIDCVNLNHEHNKALKLVKLVDSSPQMFDTKKRA